MGMALKKDIVQACRKAGVEKPVDLSHLSAQTMGDTVLEREILGMFVAQASDLMSRVRDSSSVNNVKQTAHTIKGVARSIGAFRLAELAELSEEAGSFDIVAIEQEFGSVCAYIEELSKDAGAMA